ncbi:hypothetical protein PoB_005343200 [Plakobranchus ocellatus]|uniref:Uncharacterized protein n=1 Tax=Plakobranchus ocellatus TaxID=259542 RepID=A0AAV4C6N9_9GAST|nr:hypothetical protein PoB_005343200 [Plakobranchus ocellatus]
MIRPIAPLGYAYPRFFSLAIRPVTSLSSYFIVSLRLAPPASLPVWSFPKSSLKHRKAGQVWAGRGKKKNKGRRTGLVLRTILLRRPARHEAE